MTNRIVILNVDDTASLRYGKTRMLRAAGYTVLEAESGAEALQLLRGELPQIILLDVNLPDMDGIELCRRIKTDPLTRNIPVVQVSATFTTDVDKLHGLEGGADIYLTEPFEPRELETVVSVLLRLHRSEAGLRETESRWHRFVDANVVGVIVIEADQIVEANDIFLKMLGYSRADISSRRLTWRDITPPEHRETSERAYRKLISEGSTPPFEKEYLLANGGRISVVVGAAVLDRVRKRWMSFVLDVSERKRVESEKDQAYRQERAARTHAEEATRLKDEFLANLSHELRTPMNIIIGWTHLMRTGALGADQQKRAVEAIDRAARSQAQLIEDLLDVSRIVSGKFRLEMQEFRLGPIVRSAVESLRPSIQLRHLILNVHLEDAELLVSGDPDRLQQVAWNLLSNAVKFTSAGGSVDVSLQREGDNVRMTVRDTGVGIAREFLPFVFDRFRQADGTSTREHMGMGLGLAIVRHVVELHGGTVSAESGGEGQGATFIVLLPLAAAGSSATTPVEAIRPTDVLPDGGRKWKVLLVDDDADAREVAATGLQRDGFDLRIAASAHEALDVLDKWLPDVIVSDISMPDVDGYEFIRRLREQPPEKGGRVPALALTAYARIEDAARALASGYQSHAAKPINPDELASAVANLLRR